MLFGYYRFFTGKTFIRAYIMRFTVSDEKHPSKYNYYQTPRLTVNTASLVGIPPVLLETLTCHIEEQRILGATLGYSDPPAVHALTASKVGKWQSPHVETRTKT